MDELFFEIIHPNHPYYKNRAEWLKEEFQKHRKRIEQTNKISISERLFINKVLEDYQRWKTTDQP